MTGARDWTKLPMRLRDCNLPAAKAVLAGEVFVKLLVLDPSDPEILRQSGQLRIEVWQATGRLACGAYPSGVWLDEWDADAMHWGFELGGTLVAAARLNIRTGLDECISGHHWLRAGLDLQGPIADLSRLVVRRDVSLQGLGAQLNGIRVAAARAAEARTAIVSASRENGRLLARLGFVDTGFEATYPDRPSIVFTGMCLLLRS